jgi:hypothetical protein
MWVEKDKALNHVQHAFDVCFRSTIISKYFSLGVVVLHKISDFLASNPLNDVVA